MSTPLSALYLDFIGKSEAPMILHRWSYISMLGAAIGRRVFFQHGHAIIRPNLYTIFVAEPGTRKSTAIKIAKRMLNEAGYKRFAADKTTKEGFLIWLDGTHNKEDIKKSVSAQDAVGFGMELLEGIGSDKPREAWACADELYNFLGMRNMDFITLIGELWDYEDVYSYKIRNGKDVVIPYPTISLLGGCTYETFNLTFPAEAIGTGFMSRTILVHCDPLGPECKITWPEPPNAEKYETLLAALSFLMSLDSDAEERLLPDASAMQLIDSIYKSGMGVDDLRFQHYNSRRLTSLLKLTIIMYVDRLLVENPEGLYAKGDHYVTREDVLAANTVLSMTELSMPRALGEFGASKFAKTQNKIIELLRAEGKPMSMGALWQKLIKEFDSLKDMCTQISALSTAGMITHIEHVGYTYVDRKVNNLNYVDWSYLTQQERDHYEPKK